MNTISRAMTVCSQCAEHPHTVMTRLTNSVTLLGVKGPFVQASCTEKPVSWAWAGGVDQWFAALVVVVLLLERWADFAHGSRSIEG